MQESHADTIQAGDTLGKIAGKFMVMPVASR